VSFLTFFFFANVFFARMPQNKARCAEEPIFSVQKLKAVDAGAARAAPERTAVEAKSALTDMAASSVSESRLRHSLATAAAESPPKRAREATESVRRAAAAGGLRDRSGDRQAGRTGADPRSEDRQRQRGGPGRRSESSDSDAEPPCTSTSRPGKSAAGVRSLVTLKAAAGTPERRRSIEPPTTTAAAETGGRRRRASAARPGAARPSRRHRRPKLGAPSTTARRRSSTGVDDELPTSDHGGPERAPSVPPPPPPPARVPSASRPKRPAAAGSIYGVTYAAAGSTGRQRRRTPSFQDVAGGGGGGPQLASTTSTVVRPSPSIAVLLDDLSCVAAASSGVPRAPHPRTCLPGMPFASRLFAGASRSIVATPVDCLRRCSHDYTSLRLLSPVSRSMVMSELQASMQVIGLGNTA